MFYVTKPVVFVTEDEDVANELKRLSKDEFAFSDYISSLVENDIKLKLGKRFISEKSIVEEDVTALAKVNKSNSNNSGIEPYAEILNKLDLILSMGTTVNKPKPSISNLNNLNISSTFVEPPKEKSIAIDVEHQAVKDLPKKEEVPVKKKKKKMGLGKNGLNVLSKMKSMQK